jgi:hypothetical protein
MAALHRNDLPLAEERGFASGYTQISRCQRCGIVVGYGDRCDFCKGRPTGHVDEPGEYLGRHHTEWVTTVDELLIQGDDDEAEFLLWKLVDATEAESLLARVPPFERHFQRLSQLARRRKDEKLAAQVQARYEECVRRTDEEHRAAS